MRSLLRIDGDSVGYLFLQQGLSQAPVEDRAQGEADLDDAQRQEQKCRDALNQTAVKLTASRKKVAAAFEKAVEAAEKL